MKTNEFDLMIEKTMHEPALDGCVTFYQGKIYMNGQINRGQQRLSFRVEYVKQTENENARYYVRLIDMSLELNIETCYFCNLFFADAPNVFDAYKMEQFFDSINRDMIFELAKLKYAQYQKSVSDNYYNK